MTARLERYARTVGAATLCAASVACANGESDRSADRPPVAAVPVATQEANLELSAAVPRGSVAVTSPDLQEANVLSFTVADVRNRDGRAIRITIDLQLRSDTAQTVPLGSVALFPVDQGGTFTLRIPTAARAPLARAASAPVQLVVTLAAEPPPSPDAIEPAVTIREVRWLARDG